MYVELKVRYEKQGNICSIVETQGDSLQNNVTFNKRLIEIKSAKPCATWE